MKVDEMVSSSGKTDNEEDPVWVRREKLRKLQEEQGVDLPFPFYLAGSGIVAIAAVGSSSKTNKLSESEDNSAIKHVYRCYLV